MPVKCGLLIRRRALAAGKLHRQYLKQLLYIWKSIASELVLEEFGRCPLQIHFWQQVLRYHNKRFEIGQLPPCQDSFQ